MNIINAAVLRNNLADTINSLGQDREYFLVAKNKKITSALVDIDLFEDLLALSNSNYLESIKKAREEYKKGDFVSHEEAFGEI